MRKAILTLLLFLLGLPEAYGLVRPEYEFKIFQFPRTMIPRIDGDTSDWNMVGPEYTYGLDLLNDTEDGHGANFDPKDKDVKIRVGWVKGENRLYFLYESYDDFWDMRFSEQPGTGYTNDIFEIAVDGDLSGGPFISNTGQFKNRIDGFLQFAGVHAQNYHIFTPPVNDQWCMVWGCQPWVARFPWANYAYQYNFKHGESGKLVLELWITPFDYAPNDGLEQAVVSELVENTIIGLSWSILEFDGGKRDGHINLAHNVNMVKDGSYLCAFRLMPLEPEYIPAIQADFSFTIVDMGRRMVYFKDESIGDITSWTWHFGDGATSTERFPVHQYEKPGTSYTVWLDVTGAKGTSRHSKHWEVIIK